MNCTFVQFFAVLSLLAVGTEAGFSQDIPRPEFPQPQFERKLWVNLNGEWEFEFDNDDVGLDKDWSSGKQKLSRKIIVPFCPESEMSGIADTSFHEVVWYRRAFALSDE